MGKGIKVIRLSVFLICLFAATVLTVIPQIAGAADAKQKFYQLESTMSFKSGDQSWDYLTFDPDTSYLYIGRRKAGVTVVNTRTNKIVTELEKAGDANGVTLIKEMDLGYTSNEDGTMTMFKLSTLKFIKSIKVGEDGDSSVYEPVTKRILFLQGDSKKIAALDAKTGEIVGNITLTSSKLEAPAADGNGNVFLPLRDKNVVIRLDAKKMEVTATWPTTGGDEPTGLAYDKNTKRLFVGCRGKNPVTVVMDSEDGKVVAKHEIGRGVDKVIFDPETKKVYTASGVDGTLIIYDQIDANTYKLSEALGTRCGARTMAMDPKTKKIFMVTAEGTQDQSKKVNRGPSYFYPNKFIPNTFVLLIYSQK
jgi:DNA-binding beta-propeller fold protein YncE